MKKALIGALAASSILAGVFGGVALAAGQGHTPVVVCHWVPAAPAGSHDIAGPDGGSYEVIIVDDNAANANKKLEAHAHHANDIIGAADTSCNTDID